MSDRPSPIGDPPNDDPVPAPDPDDEDDDDDEDDGPFHPAPGRALALSRHAVTTPVGQIATLLIEHISALSENSLNDPAVQAAIRTQVALPTSSLVELQRLGAHAYGAAPRVTVPSLVVQGLGDTTVAPADTRRLALRLGGPLTYAELGGTHDLIRPGAAGYEEVLRLLERVLLARS